MSGQTWRGASLEGEDRGAEAGHVMVEKGCDWPRHSASKSCQIVLLKGGSDPISFRTV